MAIQIGQLTRRIIDRLTRPMPDTVKLIEGGPNAPHLAQRPKDWSESSISAGGGWVADVKLDGIRCLYIDDRLVTLEGQPLNAARHCLAALRELQHHYGQPMFFDGEYVEEEGYEATLAAYRKGEGQGVLWLFDAVPLAEWINDKATATLAQRRAQLLINHHAVRSPWLGALALFDIPDELAARMLFAEMRKHHYEGIVLKRRASLYRRARNDDWLRMKPHDTTDMTLIDIEGNDKTGARRLVCRDISGPVILTKGFNDIRRLLWTNRDIMLGNDNAPGVLVEVGHCGRTAKGKPRHAVFSKLRQDRLPGGGG